MNYVINFILVNLESELSIIHRLSRPHRMTLATHTGEDALDAMFQYVKILKKTAYFTNFEFKWYSVSILNFVQEPIYCLVC